MDNALRDQRIQTICLFILCTIALGFTLYLLKPILIPLVLAIFFTYCLSPIIEVLIKKLRFPRPLAIVSAVLIGCLVLVLMGLVVSSSVEQVSANAGEYKAYITEIMRKFISALPLEQLNLSKRQVTEALIKTSGGSVRNFLSGTLSGVMGIMSKGTLVIIFMMFLLIGRKHVSSKKGSVLTEVESRIRRYVIALASLSAATGLLVWLVLTILGVKLAFVFGFMAFLLNFIPNIGSIVATLLPLPVVVLSPDLSVTAKALAFILPAAVQVTIGNFLTPKIMGDSLELHPITVLTSLIFFGMIWGIVGMFLATPIAAVVKLLLSRFEYTLPIAEIMRGNLPGSVVDS